MARRTREEAQQTRESILDAAIEVFHAHGVARPSLSEVARVAGVTRGAVYGHFRNKADLFDALCDRISLPTESLLASKAEDYRDDPLGALRERWSFVFRELDRNRQWEKILDIIFHRCELVIESGGIRERRLAARQSGDEMLEALLSEAVRVGQLPRDLDVKISAVLMHTALIGVLEDWVLQSRPYALPEVGMRQLEALLDMLRVAPSLRR